MYSNLGYYDGVWCLDFEAPTDAAWDGLVGTGLEPSGDFWASVAEYLAPEVCQQIELDPEAGHFYAYGSQDLLEYVREALEPLTTDAVALRSVVDKGLKAGHDFEDWGDY